MRAEVLASADAVAKRAASVIAEFAREAVAARGVFVLATSGGSTPWRMLRYLADEAVPWSKVVLCQVDERIAPDGNPDRNLTHLRRALVEHLPEPLGQLCAMPVDVKTIDIAARSYDDTVALVAGHPPVFDLIHLGLGEDGHTASLVPGDPVLAVDDMDVAVSGVYAGRRRMTLTYPVLNRARCILWVVTGASKAPMLARLMANDPTIPAGRVRADRAILIADHDASSPPSP
jgi:6-phosphogluconolactonase